MANSVYDIQCVDEELEIFTVRKKSKPDKLYHLTKRDDGSWVHTCKAIEVYGQDFICRHKKMVIQKFYVSTSHKHLFNISPQRNNSSSNGKSAHSQTG